MITKGCIVRDDLHIPEELHDKFKDFLPCPEIMAPSVELFSDSQKKLMKRNKIMIHRKTTKLVPHLMNKDNYCIHDRFLKYIDGHGVKIKKVHNIVCFNQKAWLKKYIVFNTEKGNKRKVNLRKMFLD